MFYPELRAMFDPVIDSMFQKKTHDEIRSIMKKMLTPHLDEAGGRVPENILDRFNKGSYEGLEEECLTARDEIDLRIGLSEEEGAPEDLIVHYERAGRIVEAISYFDPDIMTKENLFFFFYCLLSFVLEEDLVKQAEAELSLQYSNLNQS